MLRALNAGAIHVSVKNLSAGIDACRTGGFDCLAMSHGLIAEYMADEVNEMMFDAIVAPGAWGVPFNWRGSEEDFATGFDAMKQQIQKMHDVGVRRCATWILPGSNDLSFSENEEFHRRRLGEVALLLEGFGMSLGLEFVGPKTLRDQFKHPFYYDLKGMLGFSATVGLNVGLLVDVWHMYTSGSSLEDLAKVSASQISLVHINDAPAGVEVDAQLDNARCLPCETGVIDIKSFLNVLREIGYIGPVEAEPFDESLKALPSDKDRLEKAGRAMAKAFRV